MQDFDQFKETFRQECAELLMNVDDCLLQMSNADVDCQELTAEAFRGIHSIKGNASMFGYIRLVSFCHEFEATLSLLRSGQMAVTAEFVDAAIMAVDVLRKMIEDSLAERDIEPELGEDVIAIFEHLSAASTEDTLDPSTDRSPEEKQPSATVDTGEKPQPAAANLDNPTQSTIRVDLRKIDELVDLVGESAILQSMLIQKVTNASATTESEIMNVMQQQQQLFRSVQDSVMLLRAQPVQTIFRRMPKVVRDASRRTGKEIDLKISGGDTEIDMSLIEELVDPLVHIMRNSADHGIELPQEREKLGKPARGCIHLSAFQKGDRIVVQVKDDGRGIDREKLFSKAVSSGVVSADAELKDHEIDRLIFNTGLSTAGTVSDISGRGVGMDVVQQNIQKVGGRINVDSEPGVGTSISIVVPLTLAILDGMLVQVSTEFYLIPLISVKECGEISCSDLIDVPGTGIVAMHRGRTVPIISLGNHFGLPQTKISDSVLCVFVELDNNRMVGVVVDEIQGNRQVVVKSIRNQFDHAPGLSGGTILSDGRPAFILDIDNLVSAGVDGDYNRQTLIKQYNDSRSEVA